MRNILKLITVMLIITLPTACGSNAFEESSHEVGIASPITREEAIGIAVFDSDGQLSGKPDLTPDTTLGQQWIIPVVAGDINLEYTIAAHSGEIVSIREISSFLSTDAPYPGIMLNVPFKAQVPPGSWNATKNCGQTSILMAMAMFFRFTPTSMMITNENTWLAQYYHDNRYNDANGYYTNTSQLMKLSQLYWSYTSVYKGSQGTKDMLASSLLQGKPVVVAVRLNMAPSGTGHFMILIGMDENNVYVHDPGKTYGAANRYTYAQFDASWASQGRAYVMFTNASK